MSENPPAHLSDGHPPPKAVHHEIRNADNSAAYLIAKLRSAKERNPKLTLLDVGAGSGTISVSLAKHVPDGHVTGIDISADILSRAEAVADMAGVKNVDFCQGDVYNLPFPDATFDITHCHQVLTHLARPVDALREMIRVTKPGAIIAAREGDYETESVWPHSPILDKWHNFIAKIMKFAGGSSTAGRQLLPWALSAGVERSQIELSFSTWSYVIPSDRQTWGMCRCRSGHWNR